MVGVSGADALFELGLMYCAGRDVEVDLIEAHKWFNLAAPGYTSGDAIEAVREVAAETLPTGYDIAWEGLSYDQALRGNEAAKDYRLELSREMTKKEIAAAQKSAREWLKLH